VIQKILFHQRLGPNQNIDIMRYDLIDLQGQFKILGNTGSEKFGIGYSGSNVEWIESQLPGPTFSFLKNSGYNYFIVGATGTPQENAEGLLQVSGSINFLWTDPPTSNNRFTILLMPGEYDFANTPNELSPIEFTDYIGLSTNPYDIILRNSLGGWVIREQNGFDFGLENVYLPGEGSCYAIEQSYPRWKNVAFGGLTFDVGANAWGNIRGEYENIIIEPNTNAFYSTNTINGIFKNIYSKSLNSIFVTNSSLSGTYSNIFIGEILANDYSFMSTAELTGNFENIEVNNTTCTLFTSRGILGKFKNLKFKNVDTVFYPGISGMVDVEFENLEAENCNRVLYSDIGTLTGKLKNLVFKNTSTSVLQLTSVVATVENLTLSDQSIITTCLNCQTLIGEFKNFYVENSNLFDCSNSITGTFSNINVKDSSQCFVSPVVNVHIYDSAFLGVISNLLGSGVGNVTCKIKNITCGSVSNILLTEEIYADISNFKFVSAETFLSSTSGILSATLSNVYGGSVGLDCIRAVTNLEGTFRDLYFGDIGGVFFNGPLLCSVDNINARNVIGEAFCGVGDILDRSFRNIRLGNCGNDVFVNNSFDSDLSYFENIEVGDVAGDLFSTPYKFNGIYQNISARNITGDFFKSSHLGDNSEINIRGLYKDINVLSCNDCFIVSETNLQSIDYFRLENANIVSCQKFGGLGAFGSYSVIRNLVTEGNWSPLLFGGSLENSLIDKRNRAGSSIPDFDQNNTHIKRSKIYSTIAKPVYDNNEGIYLSEFNYVQISNLASFRNIRHNIDDADFDND